MKYIYLLLLATAQAAVQCGNNSNGWTSCSSSKVNGYDYSLWINKNVGDNFSKIPDSAADFWISKQVSSNSFSNTLVHPEYLIATAPNDGVEWFYGISNQYNKNRVIAAGEWAGPIKDAVVAMNTYKTYQATVNTAYGSLTLEAVPIAKAKYCKMDKVSLYPGAPSS